MPNLTSSVSFAAHLAHLIQNNSSLDNILQCAVDGIHHNIICGANQGAPSRSDFLQASSPIDPIQPHVSLPIQTYGLVRSRPLAVNTTVSEENLGSLETKATHRQPRSSDLVHWRLFQPPVPHQEVPLSELAIAPLIQALEEGHLRAALATRPVFRLLPIGYRTPQAATKGPDSSPDGGSPEDDSAFGLTDTIKVLEGEEHNVFQSIWQQCRERVSDSCWSIFPLTAAQHIVGFLVLKTSLAASRSEVILPQLSDEAQQARTLMAIAIYQAHLQDRLASDSASAITVEVDPAAPPLEHLDYIPASNAPLVARTHLQYPENLFRLMFEYAPIGMTMSDAEGNFFAVNQAFGKLLGYEPRELIGKTCHDLTHPDVQAVTADIFAQFRHSDRSHIQYEKIYQTRDGRHINVLLNLGVIRDAAGNPLYFICQSFDISERQRVKAALKRQAQQERVARLVLQRIRQSLNIDSILSTAVKELRELLDVDRVVIYQFRPDGSGVVNHESASHPKWSILHRVIYDPCFNGNTTQHYLQGGFAAIANIHEAKLMPCYRDLLNQLDVKASLVLPLMQNVQVPAATPKLWGLFIAHHCSGARPWNSSEIDLMRQLSDQLAIAIDQAELYGQVVTLNNNLELQVVQRTRQIQELLNFEALLRRITTSIRESLDEDQIIAAAVEALKTTLGGQHCDCAIYDEATGTATIQYEATDEPHSVQGEVNELADFDDLMPQLKAGQCIQFCELQPRPVVPNWRPRAVLACPIQDNQALLGDVWLFRSASKTFSPMEIQLAKQVADQCAIAIRQSRLFRAAQAQVEELKKLNQLKDDFLSTVSHELRTPMASIKVAVDLLEIALTDLLPDKTPVLSGRMETPASDADDLNPAVANSNRGSRIESDRPDSIQSDSVAAFDMPSAAMLNLSDPAGLDVRLGQYLYILKHECKREIGLIDDLLDLSRLDAETEPLFLSQMRLQDWIPHIGSLFEERMAQRQQHLFLDIPSDLPPFTTDFSYFERVVSELLQNACKYTSNGETIQVRVTCRPLEAASRSTTPSNVIALPPMGAHLFQFTISNSGVEIPLEERDRIFDKFYRIPSLDPWKNPGTGLGLALVEKLVEHLSGTITVETTPGWTHFILEIPSLLQQAISPWTEQDDWS